MNVTRTYTVYKNLRVFTRAVPAFLKEFPADYLFKSVKLNLYSFLEFPLLSLCGLTED